MSDGEVNELIATLERSNLRRTAAVFKSRFDALTAENERLTRELEEAKRMTSDEPRNKTHLPAFAQRLWESCVTLMEKADFKQMFRHLEEVERQLAEATKLLAELTEKLAAAERTAKAANDGREHAVRNQDRLAAELSTAKQALAAMTDERDRARDMLRQAEASSEATQQALADARAQVERVRAACEPFKAYAEEIPAAMPEDYVLVPHELTVKEWRELKAVIEAAPSPAPAKTAASEHSDSSHTPDTAHASSSQSEPADHSGDANEKVGECPHCGSDDTGAALKAPWQRRCATCGTKWSVPHDAEGNLVKQARCASSMRNDEAPCASSRHSDPAERRFVCPKCGCRTCNVQQTGDRFRCQHKGCGWSGDWPVVKTAEVEAAKDGPITAATTDIRKIVEKSNATDAANQAREAAEQRAEAAEAAAGVMKETIKRVCFVGPADGRVCSSCGSCYSPHSPQCEVGKALAAPGRAADELRALRELAEKAKSVRESFDNLMRGKLVSAEALAEHSLAHTQLRAAVSDYDQALAQGEQRGEGQR